MVAAGKKADKKPPSIDHCLECGVVDPTVPADKPMYCSDDHMRVHRVRRFKRGAEVYDMLMGNRYKRKFSRDHAIEALYAMAGIYREEDKRDRSGGQSWLEPDQK